MPKDILIQIPRLPIDLGNTFTPERFATLRSKFLRDIDRRRDKTYYPPGRRNTWVSSRNIHIITDARLEGKRLGRRGFDYEATGEDFISIRVRLYNTDIACFHATPTTLHFWNYGYSSMTTAKRVGECKRWFQMLLGERPNFDYRYSTNKSTAEQLNAINGGGAYTSLLGANYWSKYVRMDIDKRRIYFDLLHKGHLLELLAGEREQVELEGARWSPQSGHAKAGSLLDHEFCSNVNKDHTRIANVVDLDALDPIFSLWLLNQTTIQVDPYTSPGGYNDPTRGMANPHRVEFTREFLDSKEWTEQPEQVQALIPSITRERKGPWGRSLSYWNKRQGHDTHITTTLNTKMLNMCERYNSEIHRVFVKLADVSEITVSEVA
jgi:hypothetical protein